MKKLLLLLITTITFSHVSYASFPVHQNTQKEVVSEVTDFETSKPILGILSLSLSVVGSILILTPALPIGIMLNVFAVIFGFIGFFKKRSRMLSIIGVLLSILSILIVLMIISIMAFGVVGAAFGG